MTHRNDVTGDGQGAASPADAEAAQSGASSSPTGLLGHLRKLYVLSVELLGVVDLSAHFVELSPSWEPLSGYTLPELMAERLIHFIHPDDRERMTADLGRLIGVGKMQGVLYRLRRKSGEYRWFEWSGMVDDRLVYFIARDVTERVTTERALRQSEERIRALMESVPGYVVTTDLEGRIIASNRPLVGDTIEAARGMSVFDFPLGEYLNTLRDAVQQVRTSGRPACFKVRFDLSPSFTAWYSVEVGPVYRDGDIAGLTFIGTNVTAQTELEKEVLRSLEQVRAYAAELESNNAALEREVSERRQAEHALAEKEEAIRRLGAPVMQVWEGVLLLPLIGAVDASRAAQVMEKLLQSIVETAATATILDLTGVGVVDEATVCHLVNIVQAVGLLGSRCLISGISPAIARAMVDQGLTEQPIQAFGTLAGALGFALSRCAPRGIRRVRAPFSMGG